MVLVIAERFIANYGQCEIDINRKKQLTVQGGKPLLTELVNEKVFIPSACGGRGTCGYCKVKVLEGAGLLLPTETMMTLVIDDREWRLRRVDEEEWPTDGRGHRLWCWARNGAGAAFRAPWPA